VSHYRVLAVFPTLREAVRAAGLEPNPKGEKISTEDLLADWKRVAEKLGRRPSRAEYVREGKYSAGALTVRFGSWSGISTAKVAKCAKEKLPESPNLHPSKPKSLAGDPGLPKNPKLKNAKAAIRASGARDAERSDKANRARLREHGEFVLHNFSRVPLAAVPAPVVGMRRVTEEVAQMVVNTLMGARSGDLVIGKSGDLHPTARNPRALETPDLRTSVPVAASLDDEGTQRGSIYRLAPRAVHKEGDIGPSLAVNAPLVQDDGLRRGDFTPRSVMRDRPVMGEPFDRRPMTNAPVNELGVMVLFGMVAAGLGLQVESVQGKFPDCIARRQVAPGKWQYLRIEFEYESKNFKLHGHDPKGCDMIVCWRHNWKECPAEIEVVELCRFFGSR
jgi:hypothetical protein